MKKTLVALAALAATGAFAQTSVTLYGVIDAGVASYKNVGNGTQSMTAVTDGALSSSVWGLRGSEDLGGGMKANFNVESDLSMNNGTTSSSGFWRRASNVGISGNFGAIDVGVKLNPVIATNGALMTTAGNSVSTMTSGALGFSDFYTRNAITYTSPSVGGVVIQAQTGLSQSVNSSTAGSMNAISAAFTSGPFEARIATQTRNGAAAGTAASGANPSTATYTYGSSTALVTKDSGDKKTTIGGIKYTMGALQVAAATYNNESSTSPGGTLTTVRGTGFSASYKLNAQTTIGGARIASEGSTLMHGQVRYELSKRSQLYAMYGAADNASTVKFWPGASNTNVVTGSTTTPSVGIYDGGTPGTGIANVKSTAIGLGVIHTL